MVHTTTATATTTTSGPHPEVQKIIDTALPGNLLPLTTITPLQSSSRNSTYALTLGGRTTYILKLGPPPTHRPLRYETSILSAEASILQHLRATDPTLPTATLIAYDDTRTLLDAPYILMSALPGTPLPALRGTLSPPASALVDRRVRALQQQLSRTPPPSGGSFGRAVPTAPRYGTWRECFGALCEAVLRDGEEMQVLLPYEALRAAWDRWAPVLDEVVVPRLAVLDFGDGSVLVDAGSGEVSGVVDFERAVWGDEVLGGGVRELVVAAGEGEGWSRGERCRALMYSAYYSTIKIVETYYHQADGYSTEMEERKNLIKCLNSLVNWTVE